MSGADARPLPAWPLALLLGVGAVTVFDQLLDAGAVKTAVCALLTGTVVLPLLAWRGRSALAGWFTSTGGRLHVAATALCLPLAMAALDHATVTDRVLGFALLQVAAVLGLAAARRDPERVARVVAWVALPPALVAIAQALGWETTLTAGSADVVGLSGNSMRAGALAALGLVACAGLIVAGAGGASRGVPPDDGDDRVDAPGGDGRWAVPLAAVLTTALLLTRARGGKWAAVAGLVALVWVAWRRHGASPTTATLRSGLVTLSAALAVGVVAALLVGGPDALTGTKLDDSAPILSGRDPTTQVRVDLLRSGLEMTLDRPLLGVGLGRYRQYAQAYRDPDEAALPGLAGAATEVEHPHDEVLLTFIEGGVLAGLLLTLMLLLSLRHALRDALRERERLPLLGVVVCGLALALVQDAFTDPATGLAIFAVLGAVWADARREADGPGWLAAPSLAMGAGLLLLAWPRLDAHMAYRTFMRRAETHVEQQPGRPFGPTVYGPILRASRVAPGDVPIQQVFVDFARQLYLPYVGNDEGIAAVEQDIAEAEARLESLAPVPRPVDQG